MQYCREIYVISQKLRKCYVHEFCKDLEGRSVFPKLVPAISQTVKGRQRRKVKNGQKLLPCPAWMLPKEVIAPTSYQLKNQFSQTAHNKRQRHKWKFQKEKSFQWLAFAWFVFLQLLSVIQSEWHPIYFEVFKKWVVEPSIQLKTVSADRYTRNCGRSWRLLILLRIRFCKARETSTTLQINGVWWDKGTIPAYKTTP